MFAPEEFVSTLTELGITHVVWIPDTTLGQWDEALRTAPEIELVQVCREGEAWALATAYISAEPTYRGDPMPGLFESGDSLRNIVHDYRLPIYGLIGYRSFLNAASLPGDTC